MRLAWYRIAALGILALPVSAQWLNFRTPGIPRTPDGKPDLSAPAPKTADGKPDLTGIWVISRPRSTVPPPVVPSGTGNGGLRNFLPPGETIPFQPWAEELYKKRVAANGVGLPSEHCLPHGLPGAMMIPIGFQIMQTPAQIAVLFEEFNYYRRIFTDGRRLPETMNPTWFGYSVGRWEKKHAGGGYRRLQRPDLDRHQRISAYRSPSYHGALHAPRFRSHGSDGHYRRSQGVHQAVDAHTAFRAAGGL